LRHGFSDFGDKRISLHNGLADRSQILLDSLSPYQTARAVSASVSAPEADFQAFAPCSMAALKGFTLSPIFQNFVGFVEVKVCLMHGLQLGKP
jgi:hypothetical protein